MFFSTHAKQGIQSEQDKGFSDVLQVTVAFEPSHSSSGIAANSGESEGRMILRMAQTSAHERGQKVVFGWVLLHPKNPSVGALHAGRDPHGT